MILVILKIWCKFHWRECPTKKPDTGRERLILSHSSARFCFELSGNSN